jgi:hypothetical protein
MQLNEHQSSGSEPEIVKLSAKINLLSALLSHARHELEQQKNAFRELENELQRRDAQINRLRMKMQEQNDSFMQSTSWRITAPLRAVGQAVKGSRKTRIV